MRFAVGLALALLFGLHEARADDVLATDAIYLEGGGAGYAYSFNYEHIFADKLAVRVGGMYLELGQLCRERGCGFVQGTGPTDPVASLVLAPVTVSWLGWRRGSHVLEVGGGVTFAYAWDLGLDAQTGAAFGAYVELFAGYRYQPLATRGFQFRAGVIALAGDGMGWWVGSDAGTYGVLPWGYVSVGTTL